MLAAAVEDFRRVKGVRVRTLLDERLHGEVGDRWPDVAVTWVAPGGEPAAFRAAAAGADFALVIAPEFGRILETRCRWAVDAGCRLLGPAPDAVALTADKLALARHLERAGVPTPETVPAMQSVIGYPRGPWVVKPRYGAGSQETYLLTDDHPIAVVKVPGDSPFGEPLVQRFVPGRPASVALLIGPRQTVALAPAWQDLSDDGRFHYRGGSAPIPPELAARAERVARRAVAAVPGLGGSVGVDVVLGDAEDVVIEINPRLTTSYVGLRALAADNLMGLLLRLTRGVPIAEPRWCPGGVRWTADGRIDPGSRRFAEA
jgi:predicted ATP-grasp superfamily ATP-dependent carboligase